MTDRGRITDMLHLRRRGYKEAIMHFRYHFNASTLTAPSTL